MSSIFGTYSVAYSGMNVNKSALSVVSSNISNVNTSGYSRKQVSSEELVAASGGTSAGIGSGLSEISRARDTFLDQTYRQQYSQYGYWAAKSATIEDAAATLNEFTTDGTGLQETTQEFFDSWEELAKDPSSLSARQTVKEYGDSLVDMISGIDEQLSQQQADAATQVQTGVDQINDIARQIAELNGQIRQLEVGGQEASDYRDQRDALVDTLSGLTNITAKEDSNGIYEVTIGGVSLVNGTATHSLAIEGDGSISRPLKVVWKGLGMDAEINGGCVKAYMEEADQSAIAAIAEADLPYSFMASGDSSIANLRQALNAFVTTLAYAVNDLHSAGVGLDGTTGLDFFVAADSSQPLSSSNLAVNPALEDINMIAVSESGEEGDNTVANAIAGLTRAENYKADGLAMDFNEYYQMLTDWIGTQGETAAGFYDNQDSLVQQADAQRQSISSVSLDEEMTKMIMYQNAYGASARVLSTIDGLVEGLIQDLGNR